MFEHMKEHRSIIVTGPQRSGTRIAAQMIAQDTGHRFIDERQVHIDSLYRLYDALTINNTVIQCPALCRFAHAFGQNPDIAIVMMKRPVPEIVASQRRIDWNWEPIELVYYDVPDMNISEAKYRFWEKQKEIILNYYEVNYHDLEGHPLWIPKQHRVGFGALQTA